MGKRKILFSMLAAAALAAAPATANAAAWYAYIYFYAPDASGKFVGVGDSFSTDVPRFTSDPTSPWCWSNAAMYNSNCTVPIETTYKKVTDQTGTYWVADQVGLPSAEDIILASGSFEGWYYDEGLTNPVPASGIEISASSGTINLYAKTTDEHPNLTATFRIVNGKWDAFSDDPNTADEVCQVAYDSARGGYYLKEHQIPLEEHFVADDGYDQANGYWDVTPSASEPITDNVTYTYIFLKSGETPTYAISASAGEGGTISSDGVTVAGGTSENFSVAKGSSKTFAFTPDGNYEVSDVTVDGVSLGAQDSYTFENVTQPHTLSVAFAEKEDKKDDNGSSDSSGGSGSSGGGEAEVKAYRPIYMPAIEGVTTNPSAGTHFVTGHGNFTFTISANSVLRSAPSSAPWKVIATGRTSGKTLELEPTDLGGGVYQYTLRQVTESWKIAIEYDPTGNEAVAETRVWANGSTLHISASDETNAAVYSITGALVKTFSLTAGEAAEALERGVYIVKTGDKTTKVVIR